MIDRLRGVILEKNISDVVIECGGVGFRLQIPTSVYAYLPEAGLNGTLYTYLHVKEDGMELYGFADRDQQGAFRMLLGVSGVGPRVALNILSLMSGERVRLSIAAGDAKAFTQCSGVGPKLAQRLILELKDKVGDLTLAETGSPGFAAASGPASEAVSALVSLGFSQSEAAQAVSKMQPGLSLEQLVAGALRSMGGDRR